MEVLPVPRGPTNRYACAILSLATALRRVVTIGSWPISSAKRWERHRR